jgi:hypothetical protein
MEFTACAPLTNNAPVQCNSNIYVGSPSGSTLTFNYPVTCSGIISNPAWWGYSQSSYVAGNIHYYGTPAPGYAMGQPQVILPIGGTTNSPAAIIQLPTYSESLNPSTNPLSQQRYYYKADMVILVTNITTSLTGPTITNVVTQVILKNSAFDPAPMTVGYTNYAPSTFNSTNSSISNALYQMNTNWAWWFGSTNSLGATNGWLTTNATFYDARQQQTNHVTQIDVGKFGTWIATNTNCLAKWNSTNAFNGIIYVTDMRTTNGMYMDCVRLTNGQTIPAVGATNSSGNSYAIPGLTVATLNPLYIVGVYNCPNSTNVSSTNTIGTASCSVVCDALTILSQAWSDAVSLNDGEFDGYGPIPNAASSDTVNTAIIAGNVPSTGSSAIQYSGGVVNLIRLLENWGSSTLWLNTSFVNLYPSEQATAQYESPGIYYDAPTRRFSFDQNFNTVSMLPPGTPNVQVLATVTLMNLNQVYNGSALAPMAATIPSGVNVIFTYGTTGWGGTNTNAPTNAGLYYVTATVNQTNYTGVATNLFYINQAPATVTLSNLSQTYDGAGESVSVTTVPPGLMVNVTYNGATNAPTNTGSYSVVATVNDTNYEGSATNTLVIVPPATTPILLGGSTILADGTFQLSFTNTPGGSFSVLGSADPTAPVADWTLLGSAVEVSPGQFQFIDLDATNEARQFYLISSP